MTKTETETKTVKLTKDEIKEIGDLRSSISNVTLVIGLRKKELLSRLLKLSEKQNDFAKKLEDKYGKGNVNLDTGEFTSIKE